MRPLWPHEYLNSVLVHQKVSLHSRRLGWETPLHFDNSTYISTHFSQVSPPTPGLLCPRVPYFPPGLPLSPLPRGCGSVVAGRREGDGRTLLAPWSRQLTALPAQVLRDYLQGKLMVSAQADAQLARLAALQHLGKADKNPPSECVRAWPLYFPSLLAPPQHSPKDLSSSP